MPQNPVAPEISRDVVWYSFGRIQTRPKITTLEHADYKRIAIFFLSPLKQKEGLNKRLGHDEYAEQFFSPNRRKITACLCASDEGFRAPNPEIGLWRTITRNPSLIINTIRWQPVRLFGESDF